MKIPARFLIGNSRQAGIMLLTGLLAAFAVAARADIPTPPAPGYAAVETGSAVTTANHAIDLITPLIVPQDGAWQFEELGRKWQCRRGLAGTKCL